MKRIPCICYDCRRDSPIRISSKNKEIFIISSNFTKKLYEDLAKYYVEFEDGYHLVCAECRSRTPVLWWIEVTMNSLVGPLCSDHMKEIGALYEDGTKLTLFSVDSEDPDLKNKIKELKSNMVSKLEVELDPWELF